MRHAVILAGGSGTRLWPASRKGWPKQLLAFVCDDEPLIMGAINIARRVAKHIVVVTGPDLADRTRAALPKDVEILVEPAPRNTAAAIALAGWHLYNQDPDASMVVLPADHHVKNHDALVAALQSCFIAAERYNKIALVGIAPTRAETGYGYLKMADVIDNGVSNVDAFVEKPDLPTAVKYTAWGKGRWFWNAGIFCMTNQRLRQELTKQLPITFQATWLTSPKRRGRIYRDLKPVSFDVGIMEQAAEVVAARSDCGWNDVGSWHAVGQTHEPDKLGNVISGLGKTVVIDGQDNVIAGDNESLIAAVGVKGLVIVKHGNAVLVIPREQAQRVKEIVADLERQKLKDWL